MLGALRPHGLLSDSYSTSSTSAAGVTVTASSTAHTKGNWAQLIASTSAPAYGITVQVLACAASNTATSSLLDIGVGPAGSEQVIIPNLGAGYKLDEGVSNSPEVWFFPLYVPEGVRLAARMQSQVASRTAVVRILLHHRPVGLGGFVGTRVTTYGANTSTSQGVAVTHGNNVLGTAAQITASTTDRIRYMQLSHMANSRSALTDCRVMAEVRIGASTAITPLLQGAQDTGVESTSINAGNARLSRMLFDLPSGIDLRIACMVNASAATWCDFMIHGVS